MHHYPHHIGDFNAATRHLTRVERSLYRDAIELYYDTEEPLTGDFDRLCRRLIALTEQEKEGLKFVLDEYFDFVEGVYIHHRCEEEILTYRNNKTAKSNAGKASALARRQRKLDRLASQNEQNLTPVEQPLNDSSTEGQRNATNQEPRTSNQEPIKKTNKKTVADAPAFDWKKSFDEFWSEYPKKKSKDTARSKFKTKCKTHAVFEEIMAGLKRQKPHWYDPKYIPYPSTWLNAGAWKDEISEDSPSGRNYRVGSRNDKPVMANQDYGEAGRL